MFPPVRSIGQATDPPRRSRSMAYLPVMRRAIILRPILFDLVLPLA